MNDSNCWLSIITVVKDDALGFTETRDSIINAIQTLNPGAATRIEWRIVDSSLNRNEIPQLAAHAPTPTEIIWTPPRGIYPAMNDGLHRAAGTYVYFLNAGDVLEEHALTAIYEATRNQPIWIYGQVRFRDRAGKAITPPPFNYAKERALCFARGRFPPHQGIVAQTVTVQELGGFDTTYVVAADYNLMLKLAHLSDPQEIGQVVAEFREGGLSTQAWRRSVQEFHRSRQTICQPKGWKRIREKALTKRQWLLLGFVRTILEPLRQSRFKATTKLDSA